MVEEKSSRDKEEYGINWENINDYINTHYEQKTQEINKYFNAAVENFKNGIAASKPPDGEPSFEKLQKDVDNERKQIVETKKKSLKELGNIQALRKTFEEKINEHTQVIDNIEQEIQEIDSLLTQSPQLIDEKDKEKLQEIKKELESSLENYKKSKQALEEQSKAIESFPSSLFKKVNIQERSGKDTSDPRLLMLVAKKKL